MELNGVGPDRIETIEANDSGEVPINRPLDLVISLISWGFHYPVDTYLAQIRSLLSKNGVLILDVRKNTDGMKKIKEQFRHVDIIEEKAKRYRLAARQ